MKPFALLLLRISLGGLMVCWGLDKLIDVKHAVTVAEKFYGGIGRSGLRDRAHARRGQRRGARAHERRR